MKVWILVGAMVGTLGAGCFPPLPAEDDVDSSALDTAGADGSVEDSAEGGDSTTVGDTSEVPDTSEDDTAEHDTVEPDTAVEDTAVADTAVEDTVADTSAVDTTDSDTSEVHPCPTACPASTTACKVNQCDTSTGTCVEVDASDGTPCDDGLVCTISDKCIGGLCLSAQNPCDDGIACTADSCDEDLGGCVNDDGACPCAPGRPCGDGNPCNGEETCDLATYTCAQGTPLAENVPCDDHLACTDDDRCRNQECKGLTRDCSDGLPCSVDSCSEEQGGCVWDTTACVCQDDGGCPTDTNLCDGETFCDVSANACDPGTPVTCEPPANACKRSACVALTGTCAVLDRDDGTECDDGDVCTTTDTCQSGVCTGFSPVTCTPSNTCQVSVGCDPTLGCLEAPKEDGTSCQTTTGAFGKCASGSCLLPTCAGIPCPPLPGFVTTCNAHDACEYTFNSVDAAWRNDVVWIYVPAATFVMGSPDTELWFFGPVSLPLHEVTFPTGYFIGKYEVTVRVFEACAAAGACAAVATVGGNSSSQGFPRHPKDMLLPSDATDICSWLDGRRPTESEWEYAAAGSPHREYPWGQSPVPSCDANIAMMAADDGTSGCGTGASAEVGSYPSGASPFGAMDMAGNVFEYVADCWHGSLANAPTDGTAWTTECDDPGPVLRSSSFSAFGWGSPEHSFEFLRTTRRIDGSSVSRSDDTGVRCARTAP